MITGRRHFPPSTDAETNVLPAVVKLAATQPAQITESEAGRTARKLYDEREHTVEQIGGILGVSRTSIYRALQAHDAPAPTGAGGRRSAGRGAAGRGAGR